MVLAVITVQAQTSKKDSLKEVEQDYFNRLRKYVNVRMTLDTDIDEIVFSNNETSSLELSTNNSSRLVLGANYSFLGFQIGFSPDFFPGNNDDEQKGSTNLTDIRLNIYLGRWVQKFNYNQTEGYFVENTEDFVPDFQEGVDPYLQLNDLKFTTYSGETTYIANRKLSVRAIDTFREWQYRTAGSFLPTMDYEYSQSEFTNVFNPNVETGNRNEFSFNFKPAYGLKYVYRQHWFLAGQVRPGFGLSFITEEDFNDAGERTRNERFTNPIFDFDVELGVGYNSERIFGGLRFVADYRNYINRDGSGGDQSFNTFNNYAALTFGYRFNAPKFVENLFGKVDKNLKND